MAEPQASTTSPAWQRAIYVVSAVVYFAVAFLVLGSRPGGLAGELDVSALPAVNASLNGITTVLLVAGLVAIRLRQMQVHKGLMLGAFSTSTLFLVSYVVYHWFRAGPSVYTGTFVWTYRFILITHIVLAAVILPLALTTLMRGLTKDFLRHKAIAPTTLGLWLYVSVTGVLIYWMVHV